MCDNMSLDQFTLKSSQGRYSKNTSLINENIKLEKQIEKENIFIEKPERLVTPVWDSLNI